MNKNLKNILSNSNKDIDNQELLSYLSNQLSKTQSHEVEQKMADDEFMNDAMEGLQQMNDQAKIPIHLEELYAGLQKQIAKKAERKKRRWKDNPQTYIIMVILIVLILIGFVVIKKHIESRKNPPATTTLHSAVFMKRAK